MNNLLSDYTLKIGIRYNKYSLWGQRLLYDLMNHKNIETKIVEFPPTGIINKRKHFIPFSLNEKVFILDSWDEHNPTSDLLSLNTLDKFYINNNVNILKVQYSSKHQQIYNEIKKRFGISVLPFTMFYNRSFRLENFKWTNHTHRYLFCITGTFLKSRLEWIKYAQTIKNCSIQPEHRKGDLSSQKENEPYYNLLKQTKWGLILKGLGDGAKNRREVEFSSLGMPLVLNYIPEYPFRFEPNNHYVYLEQPSDLSKLEFLDPEPYSEKSKEIYNQYFSPDNGIYNSFILSYNAVKYE